MRNWPVVIFAAGVFLVTGTLAWIVKFAVDLGRAVRLP
jgi:hypothetical protein